MAYCIMAFTSRAMSRERYALRQASYVVLRTRNVDRCLDQPL